MEETTRPDGDARLRCPLCHDGLRGAIERCGGCDTAYHAGCRRELGRCATLGCAEAGPVARPAARPRTTAPWAVRADEEGAREAGGESGRPVPVQPPSLLRRAWWFVSGTPLLPLASLVVVGAVVLAIWAALVKPVHAGTILVVLAMIVLAPHGRRSR